MLSASIKRRLNYRRNYKEAEKKDSPECVRQYMLESRQKVDKGVRRTMPKAIKIAN